MTTTSNNSTNTSKPDNNKVVVLPEWTIDLIAGWSSGAAAVLACQPVDTLLTRWQAATPTALTTAATTGMRGMAVTFYQTAGFTALWRGASPMIVSVPIQNALLMTGYGFGQRWFASSGEDDDSGGDDPAVSYSKRLGAIFVGGCTGGILQSFLMSPVELIKVTQQCAQQRGIVSARRVVRNVLLSSSGGGRSQHWRCGLNATILRDGIPHGVWFVAYEAAKDIMIRVTGIEKEDDENLPVQVPLVSGAVAATVAWAVGYPADLIKTRIQANASVNIGSNSSAGVMGIRDTARQLVLEADGKVWQGLYRGFGMKLVRSVPASMIGFTVYESVKEQILRLDRLF